MSTTIYDICKTIPTLNSSGKFDVHKLNKGGEVASVADAITPSRPLYAEGLHEFTPAQLCALRVPVVTVNGRVRGYQREFDRNHARRIAVALRRGRHIPEITVAVDGNGVMFVVDGQHRAVAAAIVAKPIMGLVKHLSAAEQAQLFADQRKAKVVDRNTLILAGDGPYERYIQAAVSRDDHPWSKITSANSSSKTRISPFAMLGLLTRFVGNSGGLTMNDAIVSRWDEDLADELAPLIACFGDKKINPEPFQAMPLRSIGTTAMYVFRRNPAVQLSDRQRWIVHMPKFPWSRYGWVREGYRMTGELIAHWNKRLHESRRVDL